MWITKINIKVGVYLILTRPGCQEFMGMWEEKRRVGRKRGKRRERAHAL